LMSHLMVRGEVLLILNQMCRDIEIKICHSVSAMKGLGCCLLIGLVLVAML
jgi:hypothetical protein